MIRKSSSARDRGQELSSRSLGHERKFKNQHIEDTYEQPISDEADLANQGLLPNRGQPDRNVGDATAAQCIKELNEGLSAISSSDNIEEMIQPPTEDHGQHFVNNTVSADASGAGLSDVADSFDKDELFLDLERFNKSGNTYELDVGNGLHVENIAGGVEHDDSY